MSVLPGFLFFFLKDDVDKGPQGLLGPPAATLPPSPLKSKPPNQVKEVGSTEVQGLGTLELGQAYQYMAEDGSLWVVDAKTAMGLAYEPSLLKGEVKPVVQSWCPMWGPWYVDIQWSAYHPVVSLPSSNRLATHSTISRHKAAAQHLTSKVIQKLISLTEKQQLNV